MELRHKYDLAILLRCLRMARSNFYYYQKQLQFNNSKTTLNPVPYRYHSEYGYPNFY
jgi:hypothetical protein